MFEYPRLGVWLPLHNQRISQLIPLPATWDEDTLRPLCLREGSCDSSCAASLSGGIGFIVDCGRCGGSFPFFPVVVAADLEEDCFGGLPLAPVRLTCIVRLVSQRDVHHLARLDGPSMDAFVDSLRLLLAGVIVVEKKINHFISNLTTSASFINLFRPGH